MKKIKFVLTVFLLLVIYCYIVLYISIPENIFIMNNEKISLKILPGIELIETTMTNNSNFNESIERVNNVEEKNLIKENINYSNLEVKLFSRITLKNIKVAKLDEVKIVPVGKIIGLKLYTNGVLVVGMSEIDDANNDKAKPYENSDIKPGDIILEIDKKIIEDIDNLKQTVNNSNGKMLEITILRNGKMLNTNIIPVQTEESKYQLGLWVKDAATGVGTITFYEPQSNSFGILGHGITDSDTNNLINIESGELVTAKVISLKRGDENVPGEIKGTIINSQNRGEIIKNTQFGVFGKLNNLTALNIDKSKAIEVASRDEIKEGEAKILCSINSSNVSKEYKIEIERIYKDNDYNNKSMLIRITDEELLKQTGGIIRGLSGAPIIQNGKFIGAVTNVLVSNPELGYAIFGDMMIREMTE